MTNFYVISRPKGKEDFKYSRFFALMSEHLCLESKQTKIVTKKQVIRPLGSSAMRSGRENQVAAQRFGPAYPMLPGFAAPGMTEFGVKETVLGMRLERRANKPRDSRIFRGTKC